MIKALYVERSTGKQVYADTIKDAITRFEVVGIVVSAVKEIGTDKWHETITTKKAAPLR